MDRRGAQPDPEAGPPTGADALGEALERLVFLEWRVDQLAAVLADERAEALRLREGLAEAAGREAGLAARLAEAEARLAESHRESAALAERLARTESERAALEGRIRGDDEAGGRRSELERELLVARQRVQVKSRALAHARRRLEVLEGSRERFFRKLVEWQHLVRPGDAEEVDLAEFIAELRSEVIALDADRADASRREDALRTALAEAGVDPETVAARPVEAPAPQPPAAPQARGPDLSRLGTRRVVRPAKSDRAEASGPPAAGDGTSWFQPDLAAPERNVSEPERNVSEPERATEAERPAERNVSEPAALSLDEALRVLEEVPAAERARGLATQLTRGPAGGRPSAARALAALGGGRAAPVLCWALHRAEAPALRAALVSALGRAGGELAATATLGHLEDVDPSVRAAAVEALLRLGPEGHRLAAVEAGLADPLPTVRRRTVLAAAATPGLEAEPHLARALSDPDAGVRRAARAGLSGTRDPDLRRALARSRRASEAEGRPTPTLRPLPLSRRARPVASAEPAEDDGEAAAPALALAGHAP